MIKAFLAAATALGLGAGTAGAQDVHYWPAPALDAQLKAFPLGTPLMLKLRTDVSTKHNVPGDRIYLEVAEPLTYQGSVVLPVGTTAVGEVARSEPNGHLGRKGKLAIRLLYVDGPGGRVRLNGGSSREGKSGTALSIATIVLVSPLGVLIHGTSATIRDGTAVQAYTAEPLRFLTQAPPPAVAFVQPDATRPGGSRSGAGASNR